MARLKAEKKITVRVQANFQKKIYWRTEKYVRIGIHAAGTINVNVPEWCYVYKNVCWPFFHCCCFELTAAIMTFDIATDQKNQCHSSSSSSPEYYSHSLPIQINPFQASYLGIITLRGT